MWFNSRARIVFLEHKMKPSVNQKLLLISRKMVQPFIINTNFNRFDTCVKTNYNCTLLESEYTCEEDLSIESLTIVKIKQILEENKDDFKDLFNGTTIKIFAILISLIRFTFTNVFYVLILLFEKYGGDPLKRSLKNQLVSQFGYGMMIKNTICNPLLTWRIMFGPMPKGYIFVSCLLASFKWNSYFWKVFFLFSVLQSKIEAITF